MPAETETMRRLRQKQRMVYQDPDEQDEDEIAPRTFSVEEKLASTRYSAQFVLEKNGSDISTKFFKESGFRTPMVIKDKTGLGMRVPSENFTVSDAKKCVGSRRIIDVMDVMTQRGETMSMKDYVQYYEDKSDRERLLNVISLEFSHTKLENYVEQPKVVQQLDWVDTAWPRYLKDMQSETTNVLDKMKYPKVQRYCLMSVGGCYTDFHIDMGGTSVWYHILHGKKTFWLIPPTDENLRLYEAWTMSGKQGDEFFADKVKDCQRLTLHTGWTFMIPTGWIHAVHTPEDSLVFGGNFLHIYNASMQLRVWQIESKTHVPSQFRYPFFTEIHWYVLERYVSTLLGRNHLKIRKEEEQDEDDNESLASDDSGRSNKPPSHGYFDPSQLSCVSQTKNFKQPNVHLTRFELEGIRDIITWLENLAPTKKNVPKDIPYPAGLLADAKHVLKEHSDDDSTLAVSGECTLQWMQKKPSAVKKPKTTTTAYRKSTSSSGSSNKNNRPRPTSKGVVNAPHRRRRVRCRTCEPCTREDCRECVFCFDMKKYGGPGTSKQSCMSRKCMGPILPANAECAVCHTGDSKEEENGEGELLECGICWYIHHAVCFEQQYGLSAEAGVINEDLPSSWECPKCVDEGMQGTSQARIPKAILEAKAQRAAATEREQQTLQQTARQPKVTIVRLEDAQGIAELMRQSRNGVEDDGDGENGHEVQNDEESEEDRKEEEEKNLKSSHVTTKTVFLPSSPVPQPHASALKSPLRLTVCHLSPQKPVLRVAPMTPEKPEPKLVYVQKTPDRKLQSRQSPLSPMLSALEKKDSSRVNILQTGFQRVVDREPVLETLEKCLKIDEIRLPKISIVRLEDVKKADENTVENKNSASSANGIHSTESSVQPSIQFDSTKFAEVWNRGVKRKISSVSDVDTTSNSTLSQEEDNHSVVSISSWGEDDEVTLRRTSNRLKRRRSDSMDASTSFNSQAAEPRQSRSASRQNSQTNSLNSSSRKQTVAKRGSNSVVGSPIGRRFTRSSSSTSGRSSASSSPAPPSPKVIRGQKTSRTSSPSISSHSPGMKSPPSSSHSVTISPQVMYSKSAKYSPKLSSPRVIGVRNSPSENGRKASQKRSPTKTSPCKVVLAKVDSKVNVEQGVKVNSRGRMITPPSRFLD